MGKSVRLNDTVFVHEMRENWPILATGFLCMLFAFSAPGFSMPFLFRSVIEEFGWTREQATLLASAKYATGAVVAIIIGRAIDTVGVRTALIFLSALGGFAMVSFLWVSSLPQYYFAGFLLGIAAPGTIVSIKVMISRSFHMSQGTAMGVAMLGTALGAAIVPVTIRFLIDTYGWRAGTALMSTGIWVVALPLLIFFYRGRSAKQHSEAAANSGESSAERKQRLKEKREAGGRAIRQLMRGRPFWLIFLAVFSAAFVDQAFIQHQVLFLEVDLGFNPQYVANSIAIIGVIGFAARPLIGGFYDLLSSRGVSISYLCLVIASGLALFVVNPIVFMMFVVFRAFAHSAVLLDTTVLAKHTFGVDNLGLLLGIYTGAVNLGFMAGPWVVARMYDVSGSYSSAFVLCVFISIFAAAILLPLKPVYWLEMRARNKQDSEPPNAQVDKA